MTVQVDAFIALCVWEEILENPERYPGVENYRANHGVCETRDRVIEMTRVISEAWVAAKVFGYDSAFDYEFVPMALEYGSNAANADAPSIEYPTLGMLPVYQKDPAMLGQYIAMLMKADEERRILLQALKALKVGDQTHWTPERIDSRYNHEVTK